MQSKNNISFVIPVYNAQTTITETVDSIFNGNFEDHDEVIIVNDYSTDDTVKIIEELSKKYHPNIKIIENNTNKGCPASRNIGIKETINDYIFSLDSDNILHNNSVHRLLNELISNNADIATFGKINFFINNIKKITHKWIFKKGWFTLEDLFSGNFNPGPVGNYLFTKKAWEKVKGFSELEKGLHEAWIFTFKQLVSGSKMFISDDGFYYHRYGHESLTIREYKKNNIEENILRTALIDNMNIFTKHDRDYILNNTPVWIHRLNKRKIKLDSRNMGKNGKLCRTIYGIYSSLVNKIIHVLS